VRGGRWYREGGAEDGRVVFDGVHDGVVDNIVNLKVLIQRTGDETRAVGLLSKYEQRINKIINTKYNIK
jgi:predicted Holliday junction resolvase-like endonuclease